MRYVTAEMYETRNEVSALTAAGKRSADPAELHFTPGEQIYICLTKIVAKECAAAGLTDGADALGAWRPDHAVRLIRDLYITTPNLERPPGCADLHDAAARLAEADRSQGTSPSIRLATMFRLWTAARELGSFISHPVIAAARDQPTVPTFSPKHRHAAEASLKNMCAADLAERSLPHRLRRTTFGLLPDMTWERAMEAAALLDAGA